MLGSLFGGFDLGSILTGAASLFGIFMVVLFGRKNRKLRRENDALKTEKGIRDETDQIVEDMDRSVPKHFHIDRLLADHRTTSGDSGQAGEGGPGGDS